MKYKRKTHEEINARCEELMELGFEIHHEDSNVVCEGVYVYSMDSSVDIQFDFSAVGEIGEVGSIRYIIATVADQMYKKGREDAQHDVRKALGMFEEDSNGQ